MKFKSIEDGKLKFNCDKAFYIFGDNIRIKAIPYYHKVEILKYEFLLCDINNVKIVDNYDLAIFKNLFGTNFRDNEFSEICDFNHDWYIDIYDYIAITNEFEKAI